MRRAPVVLLIGLMLVFAGAAYAAKGGGSASGHITVADATWGGMTTATVNPGGEDTYVLVKCYAPDFGGAFVYARYFEADANNRAEIGPLSSSLWPRGDGSCTAEEGYYTRNGFGRWVVLASTTFKVAG